MRYGIGILMCVVSCAYVSAMDVCNKSVTGRKSCLCLRKYLCSMAQDKVEHLRDHANTASRRKAQKAGNHTNLIEGLPCDTTLSIHSGLLPMDEANKEESTLDLSSMLQEQQPRAQSYPCISWIEKKQPVTHSISCNIKDHYSIENHSIKQYCDALRVFNVMRQDLVTHQNLLTHTLLETHKPYNQITIYYAYTLANKQCVAYSIKALFTVPESSLTKHPLFANKDKVFLLGKHNNQHMILVLDTLINEVRKILLGTDSDLTEIYMKSKSAVNAQALLSSSQVQINTFSIKR